MTNTLSKRELGQWILAAASTIATFFIMLYIGAFVLFSSIMPVVLSAVITGIPIGLLVVLLGALLVPRYPLKIALALWLLCTGLVASLFGIQPPSYWLSTLAGGGAAVAIVAWWIRPERSPRTTRRVIISISAALLAAIGFTYTRFIDFPARPDTLSPLILNALGPNDKGVKAFYSYDLGGFFDRELLWRIDADSEAIAQLIRQLDLKSTSTVPKEFWQQPPYYWPQSTPANGKAFQSSDFSADTRGKDGNHYFLVYDEAQNQAYVWVKRNFQHS